MVWILLFCCCSIFFYTKGKNLDVEIFEWLIKSLFHPWPVNKEGLQIDSLSKQNCHNGGCDEKNNEEHVRNILLLFA